MHKVKVSQFPDRILEVDAAEYADLKAQGLIVDEIGEKETPHAEHKTSGGPDASEQQGAK